ncbi:hydrogenase nickel incorporation protein HypB [Rhodoferax sp.]|uniref:hydrogenase nickel incorporation protein HypB n=1 Tax=Rhodoferax sp. TaxID=50421 RepID=UPI00260D2EA7|nr:hydrogenase nickel incorporation protein HypB [Rhodoferax sp.]MDD2919345.1 hydrogenase nickel incorporation protein HypB [Rhodoferax sp.]
MCVTCGCGEGEVNIEGAAATHAHEHVHADGTRHSHEHPHAHEHQHDQAHDHGHAHEHTHDATPAHSHAAGLPPTRMVQIEQDILAKNNAYAARNRQQLCERGIFALNLVSSPGSGKTTLLCKTIELLGSFPVAVIEGDQQTSQDADRIRASGAQAIQINTGKGCHLDAHMVGHAMAQLQLADDALLLIENVGNLVCPAAFDLGEAHKVVILSVTEGEDKPIKYPDMFRAAGLMLLNKIDLLPHLTYDVDAAIAYARRVNPQIKVIQLSATSGEGMGEWLAYLRDGIAQAHAVKSQTMASLQAQVAHLKAQLEAQEQARSNAPA